MANADALSLMLARFGDEMTDLAGAVRRGDAEGLLEIFTRAKDARDRFVDGVDRAADTKAIAGKSRTR